MSTRSSSRRRLAAPLALFLALALVAAACGDDGEDASASTTSTEATTTTTTEATTTTTAPPTMPLTGLPVTEELAPLRTALMTKIDNNNVYARPQRGITTADVMIEELVEGSESRFVAVFHSTLTDPVGPIRSARTSDIDLMPMFGLPVFASSGGNPGTKAAIRDSGHSVFVLDGGTYDELFFRMNRDGDVRRQGPHNLFINLSELHDTVGDQGSPPVAFALWRGEGDALPDSAQPTAGVEITFGNNPTQWVWDEPSQAFLRWQRGTAHVDTDGTQVAAPNVLLLMTPYGTSRFDHRSPEARSVGSGEAWVLTDGSVIHGTWSRGAAHERYTLLDDAGEQIALTPGQTWIELLPERRTPRFLDSDPRG